jgi:uncharacterized membrane protein
VRHDREPRRLRSCSLRPTERGRSGRDGAVGAGQLGRVGCADFVGGAVSRRASPLRVAALGQLVALCFAVPVALLVGWERVTIADAAWSLASGVTAACGLGLFYSAMARGLISLVVPLTAVIGAMLPVTYGLARGERPGTTALVGIALALVAVVTVSATPGAGQTLSAAPIVFSLVAGTLFGLFIVVLSQVSDQAGLWPIALSRSTSSLVLAGLALALTRRQPSGFRQLLPAGIAIGTLEAGGIIALHTRAPARPRFDRIRAAVPLPSHDSAARDNHPQRTNVPPPTRRRRTRAQLSHPHFGAIAARHPGHADRARSCLRPGRTACKRVTRHGAGGVADPFSPWCAFRWPS